MRESTGFELMDIRANRLVLKTRKGPVEIHGIEISYRRGRSVDLGVSGIVSEGRRARLDIPGGRVRSVRIIAVSPDTFGSRGRLTVLLRR